MQQTSTEQINNFIANANAFEIPIQQALELVKVHFATIACFCICLYAFVIEEFAREAPFTNDFALLSLKVCIASFTQFKFKNQSKFEIEEMTNNP